jgi:hypothetical protein
MIDPKVTWVIDPSDGSPEVDLHITVHIGPHSRKTGKAGLHRVSVLKIRFLPMWWVRSRAPPSSGYSQPLHSSETWKGVGPVRGKVIRVECTQLDIMLQALK